MCSSDLFRMRADAHYVEQLDATPQIVTVQAISTHAIESLDGRPDDVAPLSLVESIRRQGILEPLLVQRHSGRYRVIAGRQRLAAARTLGLRDVPCLIHHVDDERARSMRDALTASQPHVEVPAQSSGTMYESALAQSLAAATSCTALLAPGTARLTRSVANDLVKAELARATYLLQASRIVRRDLPVTRTRVAAREIIDRLLSLTDAERRLRIVDVESSVTVPGDGSLWADRDQLVIGLSGVLLSLLASLEGTAGARATLGAYPEGTNHVAFVIAQEFVVFEDAPTTSPASDGDPLSPAFVIAALQRVAAAHEGRLSVSRVSGGSRVCLTVPADARRPN